MEVLALLLFVAIMVAIAYESGSENQKPKRTTSKDPGVAVRIESSYDRAPSVRAAVRESEEAWVPPGESVTVQGREVPGGMIYVGRTLRPLSGWGDADPALINPSLQAKAQRPDRAGRHLDYWPSYSEIPRSSRAAYLDWLAAGRRDPDVDIGYVFLFFYGLERRVLVDASHSAAAAAEVPAIVEEVEALREVYADQSGSFNRYSGRFLDYVRVSRGPTDPPEPSEWMSPAGYGLSSDAKLALANKIAEGEPVPPEWAVGWFRAERSRQLRTPGTRCREEFDRLFEIRYRESYGEGMVVEPKGEPLMAEYRPATSSIRESVSENVESLVDPSGLERPLARLAQLAERVEGDLDDYSRWVGSRDDWDSPAATGLLPSPIMREFAGEEALALIERLEQRIEDEEVVRDNHHAVLPSRWFVNEWPTKNDGYMTGKEAEAFARFLEGFGLGVEPDVRYTRNPSKRQHVAIFRYPEEPEPPGESFHAARLLLHLAAAVAAADDEVTEDEERHIEEHLEEALDLKPSERARLRAFLARKLHDPPTLRGVRRRAEELTSDQRHGLARFLVTVAGADGHLDAGEIQVLEKIYDILGLESDAVHSDLHDMSARAPGDRGPVVVLESDEDVAGHEIPEPEREDGEPESFDDGITLDMDRLAAVQAETRAVSSELAGVFAEEDDQDEADSHRFEVGDGLSEEHRILLDVLLDRGPCTRAEFEELAEGHGLMPGFAIEQINSLSLERCGEPLLEGHDRIELNRYALEELER